MQPTFYMVEKRNHMDAEQKKLTQEQHDELDDMSVVFIQTCLPDQQPKTQHFLMSSVDARTFVEDYGQILAAYHLEAVTLLAAYRFGEVEAADAEDGGPAHSITLFPKYITELVRSPVDGDRHRQEALGKWVYRDYLLHDRMR